MKIDIDSALTVALGMLSIVGAIYRLAQVEANINARITKVENHVLAAVDKLKDDFVVRLYTTERKLDVHLTEYEAKKEHYDYRIHDFDKRLEHQGKRIKDWIDQIVTHLYEKSSFILRDRNL